jgi:hypothetical protein
MARVDGQVYSRSRDWRSGCSRVRCVELSRDNYLGVWTLTVLCGCSTAAGGSNTAARGSAAGDVATATCDRLQACSPVLGLQMPYGDASTCTERQTVLYSSLLTASGTGWTSAGLEACAAAIPTLTCSDFLNHNLPAVCHPFGQLRNGALCADGTQCQSGTCLIDATTTPTTGCGTCGPALTGLQACNADSDCAWGSACLNLPMPRCGPLDAAGASCAGFNTCLRGLACVDGQCGSTKPAGQPCTGNSECDLYGGFACGGTCAPLPVVSAGQPCGFIGNANLSTQCESSGFCSSGNGGTCQAALNDGAACDAMTGPRCLAPAQCIANVCLILGPSCR